MEKKKILVILGSLRENSFNKAIAEFVKSLDMFNLEFADVESLPFLNEDNEEDLPENVLKFRNQVSESDGILIISPEYNWSIPGVIKNSIDWLSTNKVNLLNNKPIAVTGATSGGFGTTRMQMQLKLILFHLGARIMNQPDLLISKAQDSIKDGIVTDPALQERIKKFLLSFAQLID